VNLKSLYNNFQEIYNESGRGLQLLFTDVSDDLINFYDNMCLDGLYKNFRDEYLIDLIKEGVING